MLLIGTTSAYGQQLGVRWSPWSHGITMSCPLDTSYKKHLMGIYAKEEDRKLGYFFYTERIKLCKNFYTFAGAGIHLSARVIPNLERDAYAIFLYGPTAIIGVKYDIKKMIYLSLDAVGRVDFPFAYNQYDIGEDNNQTDFGSVNLTIGINLKR